MTQDEIIRFAIQCNLVTTGNRDGLYMDALTEFANLVAAKALAQEQEPIAFINVEERKLEWAKHTTWDTPTVVNIPKIPLYTHPPQRTWVGLTKEQLATTDWSADFRAGALWAEAKLKEKNT